MSFTTTFIQAARKSHLIELGDEDAMVWFPGDRNNETCTVEIVFGDYTETQFEVVPAAVIIIDGEGWSEVTDITGEKHRMRFRRAVPLREEDLK